MPATKLPLGNPLISRVGFHDSADFLRLAREQNVQPISRLEELLGGWPAEEREDGFEQSLMTWRNLQVQSNT
jgi:hypothetical protein